MKNTFTTTKKIVIGTVLSASVLFSACTSPANSTGDTAQDNATPSIVTTSFHEYDWVMQILGDKAANFDVSFIVDDGVDMHSFQATTPDVMAISSADLFIYNGGASEAWVDEAIEQATNENMITLKIMDTLGDNILDEEYVEGMQVDAHDHADHSEDEHADHDHAEDDHDHAEDDHDHAEDDHDHAEDEHDHAEDDHDHSEDAGADTVTEAHDHADEHIWLSLDNAVIACEAIAEALGEIDGANAELYHDNAHVYIEKLEALDAEYETVVENAQRSTVLVADRFPLLYLFDDYGIEYYAAFNGCSAETEASFETVAFLSEKVTELALDNVAVLDNSNTDLANTVITNSEQKDSEIVTFNSMQAVTKAAADSGVTYLSIMEENLVALETALN